MLADATESQAGVISLIELAVAAGAVDSYRAFWVNNSIAITTRPSFLIELSAREDVEYITLDRVHIRRDPVEQNTGIHAVPDPVVMRAASYPIRTLQLDQLWDSGLTGKGHPDLRYRRGYRRQPSVAGPQVGAGSTGPPRPRAGSTRSTAARSRSMTSQPPRTAPL